MTPETKEVRCGYRKALEKIRRIPVMPFPDPDAHFDRAFTDAVYRAWSDIQRIVTFALANPEVHNEQVFPGTLAGVPFDMPADMALHSLAKERDELRGELTEAREYATKAMRELYIICESAKQLAALLAEHWKAPADVDAISLYCTSLIYGFANAWKADPPESGFVHTLNFPEIGALELQIRRVEGKTAKEALLEMAAEMEALRAEVERERAEWAALRVRHDAAHPPEVKE